MLFARDNETDPREIQSVIDKKEQNFPFQIKSYNNAVQFNLPVGWESVYCDACLNVMSGAEIRLKF